jgi:hypothetical protein
MSYQQPPGGYPQQGYPQQSSQGYQMSNQSYQPGPAAPPAAVLQLGGLALLALGVLVAGIAGLMSGSGAGKVAVIGRMFMTLGLVCAFFALISSVQKDKEIPNSVRVMIGIVAVVALLLIFGGMGSLFGRM